MSVTNSINTLVFSKDRPAQLDLFLSSLQIHWPSLPIAVLYTHTSDQYQQGYELAQSYHPSVTFIKEEPKSFLRPSKFKKTLLNLLDPKNKYAAYFVDDIIFMASPDEAQIHQAMSNEDVLCTSLRMAPHYDWCYTRNTTITPPKFDNRQTWAWKDAGPAWGYPMSLDGHIYRTADILPMIQACSFSNPNQLEHKLNQQPITRPKMHCPAQACLVNNPANRVQDEFKNAHSNQSVSEINTRFLQAQRLDPSCVYSVEHRGPHTEFPLQFLNNPTTAKHSQ